MQRGDHDRGSELDAIRDGGDEGEQLEGIGHGHDAGHRRHPSRRRVGIVRLVVIGDDDVLDRPERFDARFLGGDGELADE